MKGCVLAKQPQELALLCRINPKFLAVIGNVTIVRAWHMHLSVVHILHGHFPPREDNACRSQIVH
jgi:hypothetical protein